MYVVSVDKARCQGHARCLVYAPEVFDFDDEGYAFVPADRSRHNELSESIRLALANCPERAIQVKDQQEI